MPVEELTRSLERLLHRVGHYTPPRWAAAGASGAPGSRADRAHALVQALADCAADAEGIQRRPVPRPDNDLALADQIRVMVADLVATDPPAEAIIAATAEIAAVTRTL